MSGWDLWTTLWTYGPTDLIDVTSPLGGLVTGALLDGGVKGLDSDGASGQARPLHAGWT